MKKQIITLAVTGLLLRSCACFNITFQTSPHTNADLIV